MRLRCLLGELVCYLLSGAYTEFITRFIVLEHDLYEQTVDMAMGYTLPAALNYNPPFTVCFNFLFGQLFETSHMLFIAGTYRSMQLDPVYQHVRGE